MKITLSDSPMPDEELEFFPVISMDEDEAKDGEVEYKDPLPVLPLKNTVLFPGVVIPITVGRDKSLKAVKAAYKGNKQIAVACQKLPIREEPAPHDINKIGTGAKIIRILKMPDGASTVIIQGIQRIQIEEYLQETPYFKATVTPIPRQNHAEKEEIQVLISSLKEMAEKIITLNPNIPSEASFALRNINNDEFLIHFIASNLNIGNQEKQEVLEFNDLYGRAQKVLSLLDKEVQVLELKNKIHDKVRTDLDKQQRDYILNQQLKTIQEELGGDSVSKEINRMKERAVKKKWSKKVAETFNRELEKLQRVNPAAAEYSVSLNYLDAILDLPWNEYSKDNFNLKRASNTLDKDHYGLEKVKERILEYLAVLKLKGDLKSPILCFVGPPGVGKTSLGRSIASALKREYVRMSLGGLHDEAEIRGHRKTYIGAMPGRIIQHIKKAGTSNPVFILDEIDKVGSDFRGDPSSALLEVLDPEQNSSFYDNYLELEYDLSKVMFIATANTLNTIQPALRDRMEIIRIEGYSTEEKTEIATKYLIPKQRETHGLKPADVKLPKKTVTAVVENYTRESGVRELDRKVAAIMRNKAKSLAMETENHVPEINPDDLKNILGITHYDRELDKEKLPYGVAIGLAYTVVGGDILYIESSLHPGKGNLTLTGNLGNVMKESATTALSYIKSHYKTLGIKMDDINKYNVHLHVPEGATPKDGPSAGITMLSALASGYLKKRIKPKYAMTGEITLRGKVLPVGGIKEKILAAKRSGVTNIILSERNRRDISEINTNYIKNMTFHYVTKMDEVLAEALEK